jgi:hypothetical protein
VPLTIKELTKDIIDPHRDSYACATTAILFFNLDSRKAAGNELRVVQKR